jgi:hypothetical protein
MSLRNVGVGIGVLQGWTVFAGLQTSDIQHADEDQFRLQTRDLYVPAGDIGLWQGALRDTSDGMHAAIAQAIDEREVISIELLYSDQVGGQRTISRFMLYPTSDDGWLVSVGRHWHLDQAGPR